MLRFTVLTLLQQNQRGLKKKSVNRNDMTSINITNLQ